MTIRHIIGILVGIAVLGTAAAASAQEVNGAIAAHGISAARAAALRECSVQAQRYPETTWSSLEFEVYRACMARHGQAE